MKRNIKSIGFLISLLFIGLSACEESIPERNVNINTGDPSKAPAGVTTGDVLDNLGTSAIFAASVSSDGGDGLLENGIIVSLNDNFTAASAGVIIGSNTATPTVGNFQMTVGGLNKSTNYYYRAYSFNLNGITYGDIKSFETANVTFSPYKTAFDPSKLADIADWVFDKYTGFDPEGVDLVWFNTDVGTTCVSCYWDDEDITIISPLIRIANPADVLSFRAYFGAYGSPLTNVKVYVTEDPDNLGEPIRSYSYAVANGTITIPMESYYGQSIYVIFVIESGDFIFWNFAIAPPAA
jgi:hypothetical protein